MKPSSAFDDDYMLNTLVGNLGSPMDVDPFGTPWSYASPDVSHSSDCFDDEVGFNGTKALRLLMKKNLSDSLTCAEAVPFGQTPENKWVLDMSKYCPVSACRFNGESPACKLGCACKQTDNCIALSYLYILICIHSHMCTHWLYYSSVVASPSSFDGRTTWRRLEIITIQLCILQKLIMDCNNRCCRFEGLR
jgi:hypothetical protein